MISWDVTLKSLLAKGWAIGRTFTVDDGVYSRQIWEGRGDGVVRGEFRLVPVWPRRTDVEKTILAASVASSQTLLPATAYELLVFATSHTPFAWDGASQVMATGSSVEMNPGGPGPKLWLRLHDFDGRPGGWHIDFVSAHDPRHVNYLLCVTP